MSNYTYLLTNPAWPDWTKVGVTHHPKKRKGGYNTGTPFNDYEFQTLLKFKHSSILEECVLIHFNGASEPKEWVNKPHNEILPILMDYKEKITKNPEYWRNWVESKKEEVEGDTYKYCKYGKEAAGSKWVFKFTDVRRLQSLIDCKELDVNPTDIDMSKTYTSRELAEVLNVYDNEGKPYNAKVSGWGKPNGNYNTWGIQRLSI